jgi:phosphatidylserine synthase
MQFALYGVSHFQILYLCFQPESMADMWKRWIYLYLSVAFIVAIPFMSYKVITMSVPKTLLLITIPAYLLLSGSFYYMFKSRSK